MEARTMIRSLSSTLGSIATSAVSAIGRRHQSTTARTKRALKVKPHPDFLTPKSGSSHIIFNPPAAVPSVYHTPFKFLPSSDPRRQANLTQLLRNSTDIRADGSALPPPMNAIEANRTMPRKYNVTMEQVEEMRHLRSSNRAQWPIKKLAAKFQCSTYFVNMCVVSTPEEKREAERVNEAYRARWGPIRTKARMERKKRRAMLLNGELY